MANAPFPTDRLDPRTLLMAYRMGVFPMAGSRTAEDFSWYLGTEKEGNIYRAHIPIGEMHISRTLRKTIYKSPFSVVTNTDFESVIRACADASRRNQEGTWISEPLIKGYCALFDAGIAHCISCYDKNGVLAGGLYGVQVGSIFCGESVFSRQTDAGKIALVHLVARLWRGGFSFLETQQITNLTGSMGGLWIPLSDYLDSLESCRDDPADFHQSGASDEQILSEYLNHRKTKNQ